MQCHISWLPNMKLALVSIAAEDVAGPLDQGCGQTDVHNDHYSTFVES